MAEKTFSGQLNYGWGRTFNLLGKVPAVSKRIFKTLADAQGFADDYNDSAIEGLLLSVVDDAENNGVYFVKRIKKNENDSPSILEKIGNKPEEIEGLNHVLCSTEEPPEEYRKDYIWLQETEDEIIEDDFTADIRTMQKAIIELTKIVQRHEYAFSNTMNCGTVSENSARLSMMAEASPEPPDDYYDGTTPMLISTLSNDKRIKEIKDYYVANNLSYGVTNKTEGWNEILPSLDEVNKYLWNYVLVTYTNDEISSSTPEIVCSYNSIRVLERVSSFYALNSSSDNAPLKSDGQYKETIPDFDEDNMYLWRYVKPIYNEDDSEDKPTYNSGANVKHLVIKSSETEQEIRDNLQNILNNELVWCEGNNGLYIKSKNKLVKINGTSGFTPDDEEDNEIEEIMAGITFINDGVGAIDFISSNGNKYTMRVTDDGELRVYDNKLNTPCPEPTGDASGKEGETVSALFLQKLYINSVYCGGEIDADGKEINEHSMNPCSHNFVELSNLTKNDINLNGLSLQYADSGTNWKVLPLFGIIKAGSTFLIRGAQCSIMNLNTTIIKVDDYDMEWKDENNKLIKFSNKSAKFYLTYGTTPCKVENPFFYDKSKPEETKLQYGYIDLVGFSSSSSYVPGAAEVNPYSFLSSNYLLQKYYAMDNVSQATKAKDKRNNVNDWYYVDLTKQDILPNLECYTPRASKYGKNIFFNKSALLEMKPTMCTITFGIQATDNGNGARATRCFNWVSKGYYDEYLWYRKKEDNNPWIRLESCKNSVDDIEKYYNRIRQESSDGTVFTAHKLVLRGLDAGEYEYTCGKTLPDKTPNWEACIEKREFIVRSDDDVKDGFSFIQVSDQQGFNWDEYQVWAYAAKYISENHAPHFLINTGDMTQNGNRINEWIDYFNAKTPLNNIEEMATIGNNDLCPKVSYQLGDGGDLSKINFANINFFYTFEIDPQNPTIFGDGDTVYGYIPSIYSFNYGKAHFLCLNSEISEKTETDILGIVNNKGIMYEKIKRWCEIDNELYSNYEWKIAYCHEMPFTIITDAVMADFYDPNKNDGKEVASKNFRGGSRINTLTKKDNEYWFGQFCQNNGIRLVMGGHKHTQAISWPIKENVVDGVVNSMKPIIQVTSTDLNSHFNGSTKLITIDDDSDLKGQSFPNKWFKDSYQDAETATINDINGQYARDCHFCTFEKVDKITAPIYSMSQATGYKHTSNKELPAESIPWCRHYYPNSAGKVNNEQRYPFYSVYTVGNDKITIDVKRVKNVLVSGKFNINIQGEALKHPINDEYVVKVDNGLSSSNDFANNNNVVIDK